MSTYVEVHCDVKCEGRDPKCRHLTFCWTNRNANPQGWSAVDAKRAAREQGWVVAPGNVAACPNCAGKRGEPFFYPGEVAYTPPVALVDRPCRDGCNNPACCSVKCYGILPPNSPLNQLEQPA